MLLVRYNCYLSDYSGRWHIDGATIYSDTIVGNAVSYPKSEKEIIPKGRKKKYKASQDADILKSISF